MGKHKHWLLYNYKVAGDASGSPGFHATGKSPSTPNTNSAGKSRKRGGQRHTSSSSSSSGGCMSAIFHLFNIHHHHFPFHQPSLISETPINFPQEIILKGVEAPRNSLELEEQQPMVEEEVASSSSSSSKIKQETNFNIPMGGIQIKTKRSRLMEDVSSECSSSSPAGTKTPNLVARLMGLDLLPENSSPRPSLSSPRPSSSSSHATPALNPLSKLSSHKNNTRSLPATPRISTAARPSTEVDYNHRLSLQINNKAENKRTYDESTSEYAKHIAKQVRESISRRVGADITNTMKKQKEQRRDELLVVLKPKRPSPPSSATVIDKSRNLDQGHLHGKENEITPVLHSCSSPRQTLSEMKNNINHLSYKPKSDSPPKSSSSLSSTEAPTTKLMKQEKPPVKLVQKCKRIIASEKYDLRLKKMNQQEDVFVKKLCNKKSTPLSNHLVNVNIVNTTTKFISFKKDMASSPASSTTEKQVPLASITQLPSCQNRSYNTNNLSVKDDVSSNCNGVAASTTRTSSVSAEYISRILSLSGIEKTTPISITQWYSPSHPLHPSIFNQLEKIFHPTTTTSSSFADRKLIFDVVDELLVEILKPYICLKPWAYSSRRNSHRMYGSELTEKLSEKISFLPAANCQVLEDIDGLIAGDMRSRNSTRVVGAVAFEEEAEELVAEMERDMVDTLVGEVALAGIIWQVGCGNRV